MLVGSAAELDREQGVEGEEGHPGGGATMPTPTGALPTVTVATTVLLAEAITETVPVPWKLLFAT
jgi:hypothetical protein